MAQTALGNNARKEVQTLLEKNNGVLTPQDVLKWAKRRKKSAVYQWLQTQGAFDSEKALLYTQLSFCRMLIVRVKVVVPDGAGQVKRIRAAVSLADERHNNGGGYRFTPKVMADDEMRERMRVTFVKELEAFERKYAAFSKLEPFVGVFQAIAQARDQAG